MVDEARSTDRLKKVQWNKAVKEGRIDQASVDAHAKASQLEQRAIINKSICRNQDGTYTLALNNAALREATSAQNPTCYLYNKTMVIIQDDVM